MYLGIFFALVVVGIFIGLAFYMRCISKRKVDGTRFYYISPILAVFYSVFAGIQTDYLVAFPSLIQTATLSSFLCYFRYLLVRFPRIHPRIN